MERVAISFNRFSSGRQAKGHSEERQFDIAKRVCAEKGWILDTESSVHGRGVSGYNEKAISKLLEQLKDTPEGCVIIVENVDRFSRLKPRIALKKIEEILDTGRSFYIYEQRTEYTASSMDDDYDQLDDFLREACRAYRDSKRKGDNVRATKRLNLARARQGGFVLTARVPFGFTVVGNDKDTRVIQVVTESANVVKEVFELTAQGWGGIRIANHMNERGIHSPSGKMWIQATVQEIIKRRAYFGEFQPTEYRDGKNIPTGKPIKGYFPAIITENLYNQARQAIQKNTSNANAKPFKDGTENLFTGILHCSKCGHTIRMGSLAKPSRPFGARALCSNAYYAKCVYAAIQKLTLEAFIIDSILYHLDPSQVVAESIKGNKLESARNRLEIIKREISLIERKIQTGDDTILNPGVTKETKERLISKMAGLEQDLKTKMDRKNTLQAEISLATQGEKPLVESLNTMADLACGAIFGCKGRVRRTRSFLSVNLKTKKKSFVERSSPAFWTNQKITITEQKSLRLRLKDALKTIVSRIDIDLESRVFTITLKGGVKLLRGHRDGAPFDPRFKILNPMTELDERFEDVLDGLFLRWMASDFSSLRVQGKARTLIAKMEFQGE